MSEVLLSAEEQEIVEEGDAARVLLDDPAFLRAIEAVRRECADAILQSDPSAKQEREDAYNLSRGLSAVTQRLVDLQARGESILAQAETQTVHLDQDNPVEPADY
ncbi:hypothetical protein [Sphingomonas asaccharolytica]|uniref:hypothetical protein n=1 Tax=Sphingomonas asaccharolytica TaxID=40681 RepID=UPI00082DBD23|nr:hypothetical protein [Sphingomonas asaccharolytica]